MHIKYHRPQRPGPEAQIMEAAITWASRFASVPFWVAGSIPVGAGFPDLVLATYRPEISKFLNAQTEYAKVLACLRTSRATSAETLSCQIGRPPRPLQKALDSLLEAEAITANDRGYKMTPRWRHILPKTVAIEAKVSDWKTAVTQAYRNSLFVHYSYVAFPEDMARRIECHPLVNQLGLGVMGVDKDGGLRIRRRALRKQPAAWYYYYSLAFTLRSTCEVIS